MRKSALIVAICLFMSIIVLSGCEQPSSSVSALLQSSDSTKQLIAYSEPTTLTQPATQAGTAGTSSLATSATGIATPSITTPTHTTATTPETKEQTPAEPAFHARDFAVYQSTNKERRVALTFDDGPYTKYTAQILDILKTYHVKATFFVVGQHAANHPTVMKRIVEEGHELGNHSWDHADLAKIDEKRMIEQIDRTDDIIQQYTGKPSNLFRPPYASMNRSVAQYAEKKHKIVLWSVDTRDWDGSTPAQMMDHVQKQLKPGGIILQHSFGGRGGQLANTVQFLPALLDYLIGQNYRVVTVSELLNATSNTSANAPSNQSNGSKPIQPQTKNAPPRN